MKLRRSPDRRQLAQRALALLACAALLYFATGGILLHLHSTGVEKACHVCQSLHTPVLAAAALALSFTPQLIARFHSPAGPAATANFISLHRASRAPPSV